MQKQTQIQLSFIKLDIKKFVKILLFINYFALQYLFLV